MGLVHNSHVIYIKQYYTIMVIIDIYIKKQSKNKYIMVY